MNNWYENIDEDIRAEVKLLRSNGFNTVASDGDELTVHLEIREEGEIERLIDLLKDYGHEHYVVSIAYVVKSSNVINREAIVIFYNEEEAEYLN